jgi:glycosyltransferase involved in cell wall biosynthesis
MPQTVSILIPAYNSEKWIAETIQSALDQTWPHKEIIVVDDGSKDATLAVAQRFASPKVKVVTQANAGAAAARNTAYGLAQGDYIQWLDADDVLHPNKVEAQLASAREVASRKVLLSGAWAYFIYRRNRAQFTPTPLWENLGPRDWLQRKMGLNLHMQTDNWLVSRQLCDAAGPWDVNLWRDNDGEYFCRVILACERVQFVPEARSYYRQAGFTSVTYIGGSNKKLESLFRSMNLHIQYLRSLEDSIATRAACVRYIRTWLHEFYPFREDLGARLIALAKHLGAEEVAPRLSWKYDWMVKLFGWGAARRAQITLPKLKAAARISWDKMLFEMEQRRREASY